MTLEADIISVTKKPNTTDTLQKPSIDIYKLLRDTFQPREIFQMAKNEWESVCDVDSIKAHLQHFSEINYVITPENKPAERSFFKTIRKTGTRYFDAWRYMDQSHQYPPQLERLVTGIGDINDTILIPWRLSKSAIKLSNRLDTYESLGDPIFTPSVFDSFLLFYNAQLHDIQSHLTMYSLTFEDHHRLRRRARSIRHYYTLVAKTLGNQQAAEMSDFLYPISAEMGEEQDAYRKLEFSGIANKDTSTTSIQEKHRQILIDFLKMHDLAI
jgi:hypothetical protein